VRFFWHGFASFLNRHPLVRVRHFWGRSPLVRVRHFRGSQMLLLLLLLRATAWLARPRLGENAVGGGNSGKGLRLWVLRQAYLISLVFSFMSSRPNWVLKRKGNSKLMILKRVARSKVCVYSGRSSELERSNKESSLNSFGQRTRIWSHNFLRRAK
jgi:hypothetical protein